MRRVLVSVLLVLVLAGVIVALPGGFAVAAGPAPYHPPTFRCGHVYNYGQDGPPIPAPPDDPFCVRYDKRDITLANGGAVRFLSLEPARIAAAGGKCRYWQRDYWSVQVAEGQNPPIVTWRGSYWFDAAAGEGAGILRGFSVFGQPASSEEAAAAVEPASPELAKFFREYGARGGGGGASSTFPPVPCG